MKTFLYCLFAILLASYSGAENLVLKLGVEIPLDKFKDSLPDAVAVNVLEFNIDDIAKAETITFPDGETLPLLDEPQDDARFHSYYFEGPGDAYADFTIAKDKSWMLGSAYSGISQTPYLIRQVSEEGTYAWIEMSGIEKPDKVEKVDASSRAWFPELPGSQMLVTRGLMDHETIANVSMIIYYTKELANITKDMDGLIDNIVAKTNQGFINSKVKIRLYARCKQLYTLPEIQKSTTTISQFLTYKGTKAALLGTNDIALLLTTSGEHGGYAIIDDYTRPVGYAIAEQSEMGLTFGHEVGHIFGLIHDRATNIKQKMTVSRPGGVGKIFKGKATIMAYPGKYNRHINYFSGSNVVDSDGDITGGYEDSARVMNERRFVFAAYGDESQECPKENGDGATGFPKYWNMYIGLPGKCPTAAPYPYQGGAMCCPVNMGCMDWSSYSYPMLDINSNCCMYGGVRCPHDMCNP